MTPDITSNRNRDLGHARPRFASLTSARFIAALWVVVFHAWQHDRWHVPAALQNVVNAAPVAVTFFFVLSGFLLTVTYVDASGTLTSSPRAFWRARAARVVPLHWLALLLVFPIVIAMWKRDGADPAPFSDVVKDGAAAFAMVQSWIPGRELAWNPPAWSIAVEAFFYLLFPLLVPPFLRRMFAARVSPVASLGLWSGGLWLLSLAPCVAYFVVDPDGLSWSGGVDARSHAPVLDVVKYHPLLRLPELIIGVLAGQAWLGGARVAGGFTVFGVVVVVVAGAAGVPYILLHNGLLAPLFALIIVGLASLPASAASSAATSIGGRIGHTLGEASYALYLLHVPLFWWMSGIAERRTGRKILEEPINVVSPSPSASSSPSSSTAPLKIRCVGACEVVRCRAEGRGSVHLGIARRQPPRRRHRHRCRLHQRVDGAAQIFRCFGPQDVAAVQRHPLQKRKEPHEQRAVLVDVFVLSRLFGPKRLDREAQLVQLVGRQVMVRERDRQLVRLDDARAAALAGVEGAPLFRAARQAHRDRHIDLHREPDDSGSPAGVPSRSGSGDQANVVSENRNRLSVSTLLSR